MTRVTIDIPDQLLAELEPRLHAEGTTVEGKALELLEAYADANRDAQMEIARRVMDRYDTAFGKLTE